MAPAGSRSHRRWFDCDQYSNCDPDELYFFYDFDSEGGLGRVRIKWIDFHNERRRIKSYAAPQGFVSEGTFLSEENHWYHLVSILLIWVYMASQAITSQEANGRYAHHWDFILLRVHGFVSGRYFIFECHYFALVQLDRKEFLAWTKCRVLRIPKYRYLFMVL